VRTSVDTRIKINSLVKLSSCFDPGVRNVVLRNDECRELLQNAFEKLTGQDGVDSDGQDIRPSPVRHIFLQKPPAQQLTENSEESGDSTMMQAAKCRRRNSDWLFYRYVLYRHL